VWIEWEFGTSKLHYDPALVASGRDEKFALAFARIECHYFGIPTPTLAPGWASHVIVFLIH
jgi:hypothetical protein